MIFDADLKTFTCEDQEAVLTESTIVGVQVTAVLSDIALSTVSADFSVTFGIE